MTNRRIHRRSIFVATDFAATLAGVAIFEVVRYYVVPGLSLRYPSILNFFASTGVLLTLPLFPLFMLGVYYLSGYYVTLTDKSKGSAIVTTAGSLLVGCMVLFMVVLLNDVLPRRRYNYELIAVSFLCIFPPVCLARLVLISFCARRDEKRHIDSRALLVVSPGVALTVPPEIEGAARSQGIEIVGVCRLDPSSEESEAQLKAEVSRRRADTFILDVPANEDEAFRMFGGLLGYGFPILVSPSPERVILGTVKADPDLSPRLVDASKITLPDSAVAIKRFLDIIVAGGGLIVTLPLMAVMAVAVKAGSEGPVFYRQERLGLHREPFLLYKFRSMVNDSEPSGPRLTTAADPRVTRVGRIMRRYRLDELPNLWNVLKGDMSLVGPRPERRYYAEKIEKVAPHYHLVHQVRPGVTSWGMVKYGYASDVSEMAGRLTYDLLYIKNLSLALDMKVLFYTIRTVLRGEGK